MKSSWICMWMCARSKIWEHIKIFVCFVFLCCSSSVRLFTSFGSGGWSSLVCFSLHTYTCAPIAIIEDSLLVWNEFIAWLMSTNSAIDRALTASYWMPAHSTQCKLHLCCIISSHTATESHVTPPCVEHLSTFIRRKFFGFKCKQKWQFVLAFVNESNLVRRHRKKGK